ncbi:type II secretion system F family protein [Ruegeria atlantica]|uniref:type II secretion system F family protein n=1 Tax=Ruegeria atlantica TaxID=81569 RepID=UPI00147AD6FD|nr:type II secretion system F family protein [Ruegeria atlantica]
MRNALMISFRRVVFNARAREEVWELVADLMESGLQMSDALETVADVARMQGAGPISDLLLDVRAGIPRAEFVERITRYAPGAEALLFQVIEQADAERIFRAAARVAGQQDKVRRAFRSALAQPMVLLVLVGVSLFMQGALFYPELQAVAPMSTWPVYAQVIGQVSMWFSDYVWHLLIGFGLVVVLLRVLMVRWTAPPRQVFDRVMPFSFYKVQAGVGFLLTVTELGRMGETLNSRLLGDLAAGATPYEKSRISAIARELEVRSWGEALQATGHDFPARDLNAILAALTGMDDWIEKFARFLDRWLNHFDRMVQERTAVLNRLLLIIVAVVMGATIFSISSISQSLQP